MQPFTAREIAYASHGHQRNPGGDLLVGHLERVAASVTPDARTVAFLHDVLEHTDTSMPELETQGLTPVEIAAIQLLTRDREESFEAHTLRIAHAKGPEGRLARAVKLADIDDHVAAELRTAPSSVKPYGWARRHVAACQARLDRVSGPLHTVA